MARGLRVSIALLGVVSTSAWVPNVMRSGKKMAAVPRHLQGASSRARESPRASSVASGGASTMTLASSNGESSVSMPKMTNAWEVHKFGGASLATPELYRTVGDLLIRESQGRGNGAIPTMAIVSAMGGMTDKLVTVVDSALEDFEQAKRNLYDTVERQVSTLRELAPPEITDEIEARIRRDAEDILSVVQSLRMIQTVPAVTMEVVTGFGEIWSAQTLHAYLATKGIPCDWIDAREILVVKGADGGLGEKGAASTGGVTPLWGETSSRMAAWWTNRGAEKGFLELDYTTQAPIVVVTGFVATSATGVPTTLKRSGSDYSATIFGKLLASSRVTMWKNTDGVYTADPRRVPDAFSIKSLKYDEAMELAYFGAQVLHPSAMIPCIENNIPVYVRNIFNPEFEGTIIQGRSTSLKSRMEGWSTETEGSLSDEGEIPIKGLTSVDQVAMVTLEGAAMAVGGVAERFMNAMSNADVNVLMITQVRKKQRNRQTISFSIKKVAQTLI